MKKIGKSVEDSKPYWEARRVARQVRIQLKKTMQLVEWNTTLEAQ